MQRQAVFSEGRLSTWKSSLERQVLSAIAVTDREHYHQWHLA